jgi:hypothetical protein
MLLCSSQRWTLLHRHTSSPRTRTSEFWSDLVSKWQCPKPFTTTQFKSSVQSSFVPFFFLIFTQMKSSYDCEKITCISWPVLEIFHTFCEQWCFHMNHADVQSFQFKVHLSQERGEPSRSAWPIHSTFLFLVPLLVIPCCSTFATSTHVCQIIN